MLPNAGRMIFSQRNSSSSSDAEVESSTSSFVPSSDKDYEEDDFPQDIKEEQLQTLNSTRLLIEKNLKKYTGIPDHCFPHVINLLSTQTNICKDDLMLTLWKSKPVHNFEQIRTVHLMNAEGDLY
ncbi:hypothetical protein JTB14_018301 [Gonioctena quinquepunctata]|nr:hypothetical protein JTB14_018301 [Gonioctena quinquepunctata]